MSRCASIMLVLAVLLKSFTLLGAPISYDRFQGNLPGGANIENYFNASALSDLQDLVQLDDKILSPEQRDFINTVSSFDLTFDVESLLKSNKIPLVGSPAFNNNNGFSVTPHKTLIVGDKKQTDLYLIYSSGESRKWFVYAKDRGALAMITLDANSELITVTIPKGQTKFYVKLSFGEKSGFDEGFIFYNVSKTLIASYIFNLSFSEKEKLVGPYKKLSDALACRKKIENIANQKDWLHFYTKLVIK